MAQFPPLIHPVDGAFPKGGYLWRVSLRTSGEAIFLFQLRNARNPPMASSLARQSYPSEMKERMIEAAAGCFQKGKGIRMARGGTAVTATSGANGKRSKGLETYQQFQEAILLGNCDEEEETLRHRGATKPNEPPSQMGNIKGKIALDPKGVPKKDNTKVTGAFLGRSSVAPRVKKKGF